MSNPSPEALATIGNEASPTSDKPTWLKVLQGIALAPVMLGGFLLLGYLTTGGETKSSNPQAACLDSRYMFDILWEVKQSLREPDSRSEEHTSELQSLKRISYADFSLKKKNSHMTSTTNQHNTHSTSNDQSTTNAYTTTK